MKKSLLVSLILISNLSLFAQAPKGRYFNNIEGTIWQSSAQVDKEAISELKNFGLSIIEITTDSLRSNSIIWTFNETLKIDSLDVITKERTLILECKYVHSEENKTLELLIEDQKFQFDYLPISTGAHVRFTKKTE